MRGRGVRANRHHIHEGRNRLRPDHLQPAAPPAYRGHAAGSKAWGQHAGLCATGHPDWTVQLKAKIVQGRVRRQGQKEIGPAS